MRERERELGVEQTRMSVQSAYKAVMEGGIPSKEDVIMQGMCREWIWEFLLKHCCDSRLLRALAVAYPIPDSSLHLKRLLLLKSLSFDLSETSFTDRTVETTSALSSLYHSEHLPSHFHVHVINSNGDSVLYPFSLSMLHLAVRVECTVQYLRPEYDDWPKFYESIERHWGNFAEDTEEPEHKEVEDDEDKDTYLQLKEELWAVQKRPELRHDLLKSRKREYVIRMMRSFLLEAWKDVGVVFLEGVALKVKEGLYVPDGFSLNDKCVTRKEAFEAEKTLPVRPVDVSMVEGSCESLRRHGGSVVGGQADAAELLTNVPLPHGSSLCQNNISLSTAKHGSHGLSTDLEKEPDLSGRPSVESLVNVKHAQSGLGCREETGNEQTDSLLPRKRKMPASLQREKTEFKLPSCSMDDLQADKRDQLRLTRSSSLVVKDALARDLVGIDASPAERYLSLNNDQLEAPGEKDTCSGDVGKTCPHMGKELRHEGVNDLEEEEQACISPPPWAGSPGLNEILTARKRPLLAPLCFGTSKTVAAACGKGNLETPVILKAQIELKNGQASLNAVVQDPLPEAMRIAEEASKVSGLVWQAREQIFSANHMNQGIPFSETADRTTPQDRGAMQGPHEKRSKKSIMERNPTAHTIEWETSDDIADSSDDRSPSHSRHVRLPKLRMRQSVAHQGGIAARNEPRRRKFRRWNLEEENVLRKEVERYGKGLWKHILQKHKDIFEGRTEVDLKDKWRNIERREGIL